MQIELEATDPPELLRATTPDGVWLRVNDSTGAGGPYVSIQGPREAVRAFIVDNWGDILDDLDFDAVTGTSRLDPHGIGTATRTPEEADVAEVAASLRGER